jgi:DNA-directed RNA polymerase subunit L
LNEQVVMAKVPDPIRYVDSTVVNDVVNYSKIDIEVKVMPSKHVDELRINLRGLAVDYSIVNGIRRAVLLYVPGYGFNRSQIEVDRRSKHMYNNDMIYNQIETLPIFDIPNEFDLCDPDLYISNEVMRKMFSTFLPEKITDNNDEEVQEDAIADSRKKLFKIELDISYKNNTDDYHFLGSHDAVLKVNGKIVNSYKIRENIALLVLKPGEELHMRAEANLGIGQMHSSYEVTTMAYHEEISDTEYEIWYETLGQLDKFTIFSKAVIILIKKLENIKKFVSSNYDEVGADQEVNIILRGEDHTIGNIIGTALQKSPHTIKAGYKVPHPMIRLIEISYLTKPDSTVKPIKLFSITIDYLLNLFNELLIKSTSQFRKAAMISI